MGWHGWHGDGMGYLPSPFFGATWCRLRPLDLSFVSSWHLLIRLAMRALEVLAVAFLAVTRMWPECDSWMTFGWPKWFHGFLIDFDVMIVLFRYLWQNFVYFVAAIAYVAAVAACGRSPPKAAQEWLAEVFDVKHQENTNCLLRNTRVGHWYGWSSDFLKLPFWSSLPSSSCALHIWRCL
jgi:hypothetical protein